MSCTGSPWNLLGDLDEFGSQYWDRKPFHASASSPFDPTPIISLRELDALLSARQLDARLLTSNGYLDPGQYRTLGLQRRDDRRWLSNPASVARRFDAGDKIVVHSAHESWGPFDALATELAELLDEQVAASLFVTPAGSVTDWHADRGHTFALQLYGTKSWKVERCRSSLAGIVQPLDLMVTPGDLLYVPKGVRHRVEGCDSTSVHLSFYLAPLTWSELTMEALARRLASRRSETLEATPLNAGWGGVSRQSWLASLGDVLQEMQAVLGELQAEADQLDADQLLPDRPRRPQTDTVEPGQFFSMGVKPDPRHGAEAT